MSSATAEMNSSQHLQRMRKGTRSCRECRRRKIRCIYPSDRAQTCNECLQHDRRCASQSQVMQHGEKMVSDNRPNLRVRVAKLESMIERLSKASPERVASTWAEAHSAEENYASAKSPPRLQSGLQELNEIDIKSQTKSPLFGLFDNEVLVRSNGDSFIPMNTSSVISFGSLNASDRDKLLATIAQEPHYLQILEVAGSWSLAWQSHYSGFKQTEALSSLRDYVKIHLRDERPIMVAAGLCCIAMSLQYLRQGIDDDDLHLSATPRDLMDKILAAVDQLVLSNEKYTTCIESINVFLLRAKIFAESNQLRKSWLHIRKAAQTGQKINLAGSGRSPADSLDRQRFMGSLFETDRFMSMVLGLPYTVDDNFNDKFARQVLLRETDHTTRIRALRRITAVAAGRINDRNTAPDLCASTTLEIQEALDNAADSMPPEWWEVTTRAEHFSDPQASHEHLMTQLWYYQVVSFLQLPFMLKATTNPLLDPNRTTCLYATRQLLKIYNTLRHNATLSAYTCKCEDFQGLIASVVLIVGLLQYSSQGIEPSCSSFEEDLDLLDVTKRNFEFESTQQGGTIAKQGLHIVNTLMTFLEDDSHSLDDIEHTMKSAILFVPYFGTISVEANASTWQTMRVKKAVMDTDEGRQNISSQQLDSFGIQTEFEDATFHKGPKSDILGAYPGYAEHTMSTPAHSLPYLGDQNTEYKGMTNSVFSNPSQVDDPPSNPFDWDRILYGSELEQQWNLAMPT